MSYKIQISKYIGGLETKEIEINENSLLTIEEVSKIFDALFECGERIETTAQSPITGGEVEAYYYKSTREGKRGHREKVLLNTAYTPDYNGEEEFKTDFLKWRKLMRDISVEGQKEAGDYLPLDDEEVRYDKMVKDKRELWDRIKTVFEHREPKQQSVQLPSELDTYEAREYFAKAKENGLIDDNYKWLKGKQLLACFCHGMNQKLNLGKGKRIAWKPFEVLFGMEKGKLRSNYNDIQKTGQSPSDITLVDSIFQ